MGITLAQLTSTTATATFPFLGEQVTLTFYPGRFTELTMTTLANINGNTVADLTAQFHAMNVELCHLIASWDVTENDAMFPLDADRLGELPLLFRIECVKQISQSATLGEANGTPSLAA